MPARCCCCGRHRTSAASCSAVGAAPWRPPSSSTPAGHARWSRAGSGYGRPRRWCAPWATWTSRATRRPARRGCRHSPGRPPGRDCGTGRSWSRCPGADTCHGWRAPPAAPRHAAGTAPGRWRPGDPTTCGAAGAGARRAAGTVPTAAASGCGPRWWGRAAPPRSWAGPFRPFRCGPRAASTCWTRCRGHPRWWSARRARSRWPRAGTPRRCCWTGGRC